MGCDSDKECQDLENWSSFKLDELNSKLGEHLEDEVYIYTMTTTILSKDTNTIKHIGSGPNLEGGLATLCTCKHWMRQSRPETWEGKWILGLTSRAKSNGFEGEHFFFYLMKVEKGFESHQALFKYLDEKNSNALQIKNAVENPLGDIFKPKSPCADPLDPKMYEDPCKNHSHGGDQWHDDIIYKNKSTPLLLGDVNHTFVWTKPLIKFKENRGSGSKKMELREILSSDFVEGWNCLR